MANVQYIFDGNKVTAVNSSGEFLDLLATKSKDYSIEVLGHAAVTHGATSALGFHLLVIS